MNTKKILMITRNLPPLIGGMERLNWHIADELGQKNEVHLLSHIEAKKQAPIQCKFYGVALNPLPIFLIFAFFKALFICLSQKPDVLLAGSGLTGPIVVFWAKVFRKKSIIYLHGLDISNNSRAYQKIWIPFIRSADSIICNSTPTKKLALDKKIQDSKISIIYPGVNFPPKEKNEDITNKLKDKFSLHNKKILLSVGRLTERKGLLEFIQNCLPQIVQECPDSVLLIIGDTANNALNNKFQNKEDLLEAAKKIKVDQHIIFTGAVDEQALTEFYYMASIHVFPVKHIPNDPEGFGMVAIEAASYGLPTIAFATGGIVDAVQNEESGYLIPNQDYEKLTLQIINFLQKENNLAKNCQFFASQFAWKNLGYKFGKLIDSNNDSSS
ncbi:glycosyltransferase [Acinetobacter cumulans]|jgi:phosphatidylinositol alpha-1,6-mannosyltransferase|uniref:glycosyltransferase family 4 protein n=1 Tax=Acinetobacter cumulans TaxID=2136182 RepID=UPI000D115B7F|nr:glycosyltransferase family 4 protein [Acinetobacter cumulans]QCO20462.1 glycosyltransferase [Acinetobacter cumulans]